MSEELPHALLRCTECSTAFRVTLKKGRVPSKPIPCPKCKTPITVRPEDVHEGRRQGGVAMAASDLRSTRAAKKLRETQEVKADAEAVARFLHTPATAAADASAEVEEVVEASEPSEAKDAGGTPGFGIVMRRGSKRKKSNVDAADDLSLTVASAGVHVVSVGGAAGRDAVFDPAPRGTSGEQGAALGRINIKRVAASSLRVAIDDPDLPAPVDSSASSNTPVAPVEPDLPVPDLEEDVGEPVAAPVELDEKSDAALDEKSDAPEEPEPPAPSSDKGRPKLDLSKLKRALTRLDAEEKSHASEASSVEEPDLNLEDSDIVAAFEHASEAEDVAFDDASESPLAIDELDGLDGLETSDAGEFGFDDLDDVEDVDIALPEAPEYDVEAALSEASSAEVDRSEPAETSEPIEMSEPSELSEPSEPSEPEDEAASLAENSSEGVVATTPKPGGIPLSAIIIGGFILVVLVLIGLYTIL